MTPPRPSVYAGLLLLSAATLLLEVTLTRVLSVGLWYHFAFMVVSTALFGFGFAGVALSLRRDARSIPARLLAWGAACTPWAFALGYWLFNLIPFEPFSLGIEVAQWVFLPLAYLAVTLPFFFAGLTVSSVLTRHATYVHRLYFFDLLGAGTGCLLATVLIPRLGGSGTVLAAALLAAVAAGLLAREAGGRWAIAPAIAVVVLLGAIPFSERLVPVRISRDKNIGGGPPIGQVLADPRRNLFTEWNTLSRVDVIQNQSQRIVLIDAGTAVTRVAHPEKEIDRLGPTDDEEGFFVRLFPSPRVLVVGSGGGREVLLALRNGAGRVTGVEINPAINEVVADRMSEFTGHLYQHPKVEAVTDEARSHLRRSLQRYQVIHCPHTISNAAMASGALGLSENHLMTLEAFHDYFDHLAPDGVLVVTRPEAHMPRLFSTVRAAFGARFPGRDFAAHVMAWREPAAGLSFYAGFAFRAVAFSPGEVDAFAAVLRKKRLEALFLPGGQGVAPYRDLATAADPLAVKVPFSAILEPATDDRPFFNRRVSLPQMRLSDLVAVFSRGRDARMALEDRPVAEAALLVLLAETVVLAFLFIVLPLAVFRRRALGGGGRLRMLLAFMSLGAGYIVVEVGFIQRFTLHLGKPVVVFATVLGTLLIASGLGSAFARRWRGEVAPVRACVVAAAAAALGGLLAPGIVDATLAWSEGGRIAVAVLVLAPCGLVMGMPFPLLVRRLEAARPERIPWAWGVNGFASVVGSIGAVVVGMTAGYTVVLLAGVAFYLAAAAAAAGDRWLAQPVGFD